MGYIVYGVAESDTTEQRSPHLVFFFGKPQKIWGLSNPSDVSLSIISIGLN